MEGREEDRSSDWEEIGKAVKAGGMGREVVSEQIEGSGCRGGGGVDEGCQRHIFPGD